MKRRVWTKPSHHTKEKKTEHVTLNTQALAILQRMSEDASGPYLFPGREAKTARTTVRNAWKQVCKSAGFATVSYKVGKRGKAAAAMEVDRPRVRSTPYVREPSGIARALTTEDRKTYGAYTGSTTQRYAHIADSALRDVTDAFPNVLPIKRLA